jgi:hypothetical protein
VETGLLLLAVLLVLVMILHRTGPQGEDQFRCQHPLTHFALNPFAFAR